MNYKTIRLLFLSIVLLILLSSAAGAQMPVLDDYDQSALLMLHSKNTMQGSQDANELRQLAGYYEDYYNGAITRLQSSGQDPDGKLTAALQKERDEKVTPLQTQANVLDAARQNRPKNNAVRKVARFFGRIIKGGGRALGFGVSKTMEGISKGAQIVVDEVAPKVIEGVVQHAKTALLSGGSLEGQALRTLVRELFQKHATGALKARLLPKVARLAENMLGQQAAEAVAILTGQGVNAQAGIPTSQPDTAAAPDNADTPANPLNLSPQEKAAMGMHTYVYTHTYPDGTVETGVDTDKREYRFTETGVDFYVPVDVFIYSYIRVGPNQYITEGGWTTLIFTNDGVHLESQDGKITDAIRTD